MIIRSSTKLCVLRLLDDVGFLPFDVIKDLNTAKRNMADIMVPSSWYAEQVSAYCATNDHYILPRSHPARLDELVPIRPQFKALLTLSLHARQLDEAKEVNLDINKCQLHRDFYLPDVLLYHISLDRASLLNLRLVSRPFRDWVTEVAFSQISLTFPPSPEVLNEPWDDHYLAWMQIGPHIKSLHIKVHPTLTYWRDLRSLWLQSIIYELHNLECLTIDLQGLDEDSMSAHNHNNRRPLWVWPTDNFFAGCQSSQPHHHGPLVAIREILEGSFDVLTKLRILRLSNMTIEGIQALRCSSLASFRANGVQRRWHCVVPALWERFTYLKIDIIKWWDSKFIALPPNMRSSILVDTVRRQANANLGLSDTPTGIQRPKKDKSPQARRARDEFRQGLLQLHDFLKGFSTSLETLDFDWLHSPSELDSLLVQASSSYGVDLKTFTPYPGINPFVIEQFVKAGEFSSQEIGWRKLGQVRLGGMRMIAKHLDLMRKRAKDMRVLMIPRQCLGAGIPQIKSVSDEHGYLWTLLAV